jgi:hypothetical protein
MSILSSLTSVPVGLIISTPWIGGTVIVIKVSSYRIGFLYSITLGLLAFGAFRLTAQVPNPHPAQYVYELWAFFLLLGLVTGTIVWCIAAGADTLFKRLTHSVSENSLGTD